jgi:two-component system, NarL family, sensor kinase
VSEGRLEDDLTSRNSPKDINRSTPRLPKWSAASTQITAWTEMLSMIGQKNSYLYGYLGQHAAPRQKGNSVLHELERERSRISRELHAGAGQPLAGIKLNLEILDDCYSTLPQRGREALARLQTLTQQALEQVRAVSHRLHPPDWQHLDVTEALQNLVDASGLAASMAVDLNLQPLTGEPPHAVRIALYRCAQECISNVIRHSGATRFGLYLQSRSGVIELRVEDNGRGFAPDSGIKGIGLVALRDLARSLEGCCRVASGPTGTTISIQLPLTED